MNLLKKLVLWLSCNSFDLLLATNWRFTIIDFINLVVVVTTLFSFILSGADIILILLLWVVHLIFSSIAAMRTIPRRLALWTTPLLQRPVSLHSLVDDILGRGGILDSLGSLNIQLLLS